MQKLNKNGYLTADVFPKIDYSLCGFSPVHGDLIAVLDLYMDESGTHDNKHLVVGGYVSRVEKWVSFSQEWKKVLEAYSLPYFHMKDFRNPKSRMYRHLSVRDRESLFDSLADIVCRNVLFGAFFFTCPYWYDRLTTPVFRSRHGSSYAHAVQGCIALVIASLRKMNAGSEVLGIFMEEGHRNAQEVVEVIRELKKETDPTELPEEMDGSVYGDPLSIDPRPYSKEDDHLLQEGLKIGAYGLGSKKIMLPLQAADVFSYCMHDAVNRPETYSSRRIMSKLSRGIPHYGLVEDKKRILELVEFTQKNEQIRAEQNRRKYILKRELQQSGFIVEKRQRGFIVKGGSLRMAAFAALKGLKLIKGN